MSRNGRGHGGDDSGIGCLVIMTLALIAMPLVRLYLILRRDGETKAIGWSFLIVGCIFWLYVMAKSSS